VTSPIISLDDQLLNDLEKLVFIKNANGIYVYCNEEFVSFLGILKNKILGRTAHNIAPNKLADLYVAADKDLYEAGGYQRYESQVRTSNKTTGVIFNKVVLRSPEGEIAGFIGIVDSLVSSKAGVEQLEKLTPREMGVLKLLIRGLPVKAIAAELGISNHTASGHLKAIYSKLDAHSKNEALFKAISLFASLP
jgi:DNA-binding CsgD family transcriptional regulator